MSSSRFNTAMSTATQAITAPPAAQMPAPGPAHEQTMAPLAAPEPAAAHFAPDFAAALTAILAPIFLAINADAAFKEAALPTITSPATGAVTLILVLAPSIAVWLSGPRTAPFEAAGSANGAVLGPLSQTA